MHWLIGITYALHGETHPGNLTFAKKSLSGKQASRIFQIKTIEQFLGYSGLTKHNYKVASIVGLGPIVLPPIMQSSAFIPAKHD